MPENQTHDTPEGAVAPAATGSPFRRCQRVRHALNGTAGIITIEGTERNAGPTWWVRFERPNGFEEVEMWEWEILPENIKTHTPHERP